MFSPGVVGCVERLTYGCGMSTAEIGRTVRLVAWVAGDRLHDLRVAVNRKHNGALFGTVAAAGNHRQNVSAVGQVESDGERAIATNFDRLAPQRYPCIGLGHTVNDQFGVDLELEPLPVAVMRPTCPTRSAK